MYGGLLLDTIIYTVLMFFYCTVARVLMRNECENVSYATYTFFFFFFYL